jgi:hypothetical protein
MPAPDCCATHTLQIRNTARPPVRLQVWQVGGTSCAATRAMGSASLSRALVGSLYIKIIIPTYSRRPPLTEKVVSPLRFPFSLGSLNSRAGRVRGGFAAASRMKFSHKCCADAWSVPSSLTRAPGRHIIGLSAGAPPWSPKKGITKASARRTLAHKFLAFVGPAVAFVS